MNLQAAILDLAPLHRAAARVPILDYASRPDHIARDGDGAIVVWEGASEATIYRDAKVNHAFRAWHDAVHLRHNLGFSLEAERAVCELQIMELLGRFPLTPRAVIDTIRAEVTGQAEYFARTGAFPANQAAFIAAYLRRDKP